MGVGGIQVGAIRSSGCSTPPRSVPAPCQGARGFFGIFPVAAPPGAAYHRLISSAPSGRTQILGRDGNTRNARLLRCRTNRRAIASAIHPSFEHRTGFVFEECKQILSFDELFVLGLLSRRQLALVGFLKLLLRVDVLMGHGGGVFGQRLGAAQADGQLDLFLTLTASQPYSL